MALHALAYCERLFYLEDVEEIGSPITASMPGVRRTRGSTRKASLAVSISHGDQHTDRIREIHAQRA
jgi:hypothetical protein